jgi:hypothetical protein
LYNINNYFLCIMQINVVLHKFILTLRIGYDMIIMLGLLQGIGNDLSVVPFFVYSRNSNRPSPTIGHIIQDEAIFLLTLLTIMNKVCIITPNSFILRRRA